VSVLTNMCLYPFIFLWCGYVWTFILIWLSYPSNKVLPQNVVMCESQVLDVVM